MGCRSSNRGPSARQALVFAVLLIAGGGVVAGQFRDRWAQRRAGDRPFLPQGVRVVGDVAYGPGPEQRFDVYAPEHARGAPVIFMVHGGAWAFGDKGARPLVEAKIARWVPRGFVFVSANYRLVPKATPLEQAQDVARALAAVQERAVSWGADGGKVVLVGHSAGAHLVALVSASSWIASQAGARPWLGTVALDSAALDVVDVMERRHFAFYDRAFGADPAQWRAASPFQALRKMGPPILCVCSSRRNDSCPQSAKFIARARSLGIRADRLEEDLSHREINEQLGEEGSYTAAVEGFLASLDSTVARALSSASRR